MIAYDWHIEFAANSHGLLWGVGLLVLVAAVITWGVLAERRLDREQGRPYDWKRDGR